MDNNFYSLGKSAVNFCENDINSFGFGEIYNVISSFAITLFGLYGLYRLYKLYNPDNLDNQYNRYNQYNQYKSKILLNSFVLYVLLSLIGLGSAYFHHDLSPFAHWVDIILISLILVYAQYMLTSKPYMPLHKTKYFFILLFHFVISILIPQLHIFLLFASGFEVKNLIKSKIDLMCLIYSCDSNNISKSNNLIKKYNHISNFFCISLICWIIDYFGCWYISPYHTHWIFHILIGYVGYKIIDMVKDIYI
jgi:hypothetical protein